MARRIGVRELLGEGGWGLERARFVANEIKDDVRAVKALVACMFGDDAEVRKRAADVARRITDHDVAVLWRYADQLAGLLGGLTPEESRTRWHLGLVVSRVAHTREQRLRAARLMELLINDESNVARCSAVEGIGWLACEELSLLGVAEDMIDRVLRDGTKAMKCRARHARLRLELARKLRGDLG